MSSNSISLGGAAASCCVLILLHLHAIAATPIAPTTLDGATPIESKVSTAEFDAFDAEFAAAEEQEQQQKQEQQNSNSDSSFKISLLPTPAKTAESVNLEHEAIPSKVFSAYDNSQKKLSDITHPVPILDSISEHEKYGNNGDMFDGISRSIVNGYEVFSNLLNNLIQKPKQLARSFTKGITAQLDIIGGKLVGL